jgi:outer membrane protein assembly factor BamB
VPFGGVDPIYAMGSDGLLRTLRVTDGANMAPPVVFLPPNTRPAALLWADGMVYTTTSHGCGAAPNAVWALDTTTAEPTVARWETGGPDIAGASGVTLGTDGTVYVALRRYVGPNFSSGAPNVSSGGPPQYASSVVALDRLTLAVKDWFTANDADFNASPVVFRHKDRDLVVVSGSDGRLYVLDGNGIGGADHRTPLHVTPKYSAAGADAALATWDDGETRWVLAPAIGAPVEGLAFAANGPAPDGSVVAFRVVERDGLVTLEPAWRSGNLHAPLAPIVVNGVVFAASGGEHRPEAPAMSAAERARRSTSAVLYAIDGATGRQLWSSGSAITSFARAGLSAGGGQVYLVTYDNTLYAFGIPLEH